MTTRLLLACALVLAAPLHAQADSITVPAPLTLREAMRLGRTHAVNAALAQIGARSAGARVGERRADLLPTISGAATLTRQRLNLDEFGIPAATGVTDPFNIWRFEATGTQTVFDASALKRVSSARDSAIAAGLDARAAGDLAASAAGVAWLRFAAADETVRAREADSAVAGALYQQATDLVKAGVSPAIDGTRSEVSFAAARTDLELARNRRDRARLDLARALSVDPGTVLVLPDSVTTLGTPFPEDPDSAVAFAYAHRPELAAEAARTQAIRKALASVRLEQLPSVGVQGKVQESGRQLGGLAATWNVQLGVRVPVLDGFRRQRRIEEQSLRLQAQEVRERDLERQVATDMRMALLDLTSARQQVSLAENRLRLAEQELTEARQRFSAGVAGSVETTTAQGAVVTARDAVVQAHAALGTAEVNALHAAGLLNDDQ